MKITFMKGPLYDIFWHCCKQSLNMDRSSQTVNLQKEVEFYVAMIALLPWSMKTMLRKELMEVHKSWMRGLFSKETVMLGNRNKNFVSILIIKFVKVKFTLWLNDCRSNHFFFSSYFGRNFMFINLRDSKFSWCRKTVCIEV